MQDSKFDITMQLSAIKLDKKDFFGKVLKLYLVLPFWGDGIPKKYL